MSGWVQQPNVLKLKSAKVGLREVYIYSAAEDALCSIMAQPYACSIHKHDYQIMSQKNELLRMLTADVGGCEHRLMPHRVLIIYWAEVVTESI